MADKNLTIKDVADLLDRSTMTVRIWRCESGKVIPQHMLDLLKLKLAHPQ
jgi:hypothetical protein